MRNQWGIVETETNIDYYPSIASTSIAINNPWYSPYLTSTQGRRSTRCLRNPNWYWSIVRHDTPQSGELLRELLGELLAEARNDAIFDREQ